MSDLISLHSAHFEHCRARVDKHFEGYCSLQWMEAGAVELFYDEQRYDLSADEKSTWFWPTYPGPRIRFHAAREVHEWNHRYVALTGERLETWKRVGLWPQKPQVAPRGGEHRAQFDELLRHIQRGGVWGIRRATHALEGILLELAEARASEPTEAAWLRETRRFLAETTDFSPDYGLLARDLGVGLSTLRRNYRAATGISLHEALLQKRLDLARSLLSETDWPLKRIASELGYRDVFFFSNQFKKLARVSPSTYRKSRQR